MLRKDTHDSLQESISLSVFDIEANERDIRAGLATANTPADIIELLLPQMLSDRRIDQALWAKSMAYWKPVLNSIYGRDLKWQDFFGLSQADIRACAILMRDSIPQDSPVRWDFKIPHEVSEVSITWQCLKTAKSESVPRKNQ
jgi:hypothetical protein